MSRRVTGFFALLCTSWLWVSVGAMDAYGARDAYGAMDTYGYDCTSVRPLLTKEVYPGGSGSCTETCRIEVEQYFREIESAPDATWQPGAKVCVSQLRALEEGVGTRYGLEPVEIKKPKLVKPHEDGFYDDDPFDEPSDSFDTRSITVCLATVSAATFVRSPSDGGKGKQSSGSHGRTALASAACFVPGFLKRTKSIMSCQYRSHVQIKRSDGRYVYQKAVRTRRDKPDQCISSHLRVRER